MTDPAIPDWLRTALDDVVAQAVETVLDGAVLVSSCEPCALCQVVATAAGVREIVYAAPKEYVPDLGGTEPPDVTAAMVRLQTTVAGLGVVQLQYVETARAREPFELFAAGR